MTYGRQEEMGRAPCCSKVGLHKGSCTTKEDALLTRYIQANGEGRWRSLPQKAGLIRCGKSCRLRWMNYLRPGIKRGNITADEEDLIIRLQSHLGNRWSLIAGRLPGRTDNEIKNHWNTHILKRLKKEGMEPRESRDKHQLIKTSQKNPKRKNPTAKSGKQDDEVSPKNIETIEPCCSSSGPTASSNVPVESLALSGSSTSNNQKDVDKEESTREVWDISWSSFDQLDELSFIQEEEMALNDNNLLEQVYNEYLQLL